MSIIPGPNNQLITASLPPAYPLSALVLTTTVPTASAFAGSRCMIAFDTASFYICVAENTWKKVDLSTF